VGARPPAGAREPRGAAGVSLLGTVLGATRPGPLDLVGYRLAFVCAACLMALGAVFAARVSDAAAATMTGDGPDGLPETVPEAA
jgi:hypothetical protein